MGVSECDGVFVGREEEVDEAEDEEHMLVCDCVGGLIQSCGGGPEDVDTP